jgi:hypothetical protein
MGWLGRYLHMKFYGFGGGFVGCQWSRWSRWSR